LKEALQGVADGYDFVLLDTPPSLSLLTVNVFAYAQEVIVPCQTHPYAYGALDELFDTIGAIQTEINPKLKVSGIVATLFDRRTRVSPQVLEKLRTDDAYRSLLFDTLIRVNTTIADSAEVGKPVVFYRSGSYGAIDYRELAQEVLKRA
jgi:chromosome partitioning protein